MCAQPRGRASSPLRDFSPSPRAGVGVGGGHAVSTIWCGSSGGKSDSIRRLCCRQASQDAPVPPDWFWRATGGPQPSGSAPGFARTRAGRSAGSVVVLLKTMVYVMAAGWIAASVSSPSKASAKLGKPVTVGRGRGGFGAIVLDNVSIAGAPGKPPLMTMRHIRVPLMVALGARGPIRIEGLRIAAVKGGDDDNVSDIIDGLRGGKKKGQGKETDVVADKADKPAALVPTKDLAVLHRMFRMVLFFLARTILSQGY